MIVCGCVDLGVCVGAFVKVIAIVVVIVIVCARARAWIGVLTILYNIMPS